MKGARCIIAACIALTNADKVLKLTPESFKKQLMKIGDKEQLLVDHSPFSTFEDLFKAAAGQQGAEHAGLTLGHLDCLEHMDWCDQELQAEVWNGLRIYHKGAKASKSAAVEIPIGAFPAADKDGGIERLLSLAGTTREAAKKLAKTWLDDAKAAGFKAADASSTPIITNTNFRDIVGKVFKDPEHQVWIFYHGAWNTCEESKGEFMEAYQALTVAERTKVTLATVNCDVFNEPCDSASLAQYCHAAHHRKKNTCPQTYGPSGTAMYLEEPVKDEILKEMRKYLPASVKAVSHHDHDDEL